MPDHDHYITSTTHIYNVTIKAEKKIAADWLQWLLNKHIPEVMETGCFTHYHVLRLLDTDENDGPTYAIQYYSKSIEDYKKYINRYADALRKKSTDRWGDAFTSFRTLLEVVQ
jgi:hypothetical protein